MPLRRVGKQEAHSQLLSVSPESAARVERKMDQPNGPDEGDVFSLVHKAKEGDREALRIWRV